jgi:hypothetical protein
MQTRNVLANQNCISDKKNIPLTSLILLQIEIPKKKMKSYRFENNILNSVLDFDSNKTTTKQICSKVPMLCSAKDTA